MRSTCQRSYTQPGALPICRSIQVFEEVFSSCAQRHNVPEDRNLQIVQPG
jgi:hypothetical protein